MAKIVKKLFGDNPETIHVLHEVVTFDNAGYAEVSDEAAAVFGVCPGYQVEEASNTEEEEESNTTEETGENTEEEEESNTTEETGENTEEVEEDEASTEEVEVVAEVAVARPKKLKKAVPNKK